MTVASVGLLVIDNVLSDPMGYRDLALTREFRTYEFPHCKFHGIAVVNALPGELYEQLPSKPDLAFFRKSPAGQVEPHFIHTDIDMGDWSALLYLNPEPPKGDGTDFWMHNVTGEVSNKTPHLRSIEGLEKSNWTKRHHVEAKFNRLVLFGSDYYHSRAIFDNWGEGNDARLVQVAFGKGAL